MRFFKVKLYFGNGKLEAKVLVANKLSRGMFNAIFFGKLKIIYINRNMELWRVIYSLLHEWMHYISSIIYDDVWVHKTDILLDYFDVIFWHFWAKHVDHNPVREKILKPILNDYKKFFKKQST